MRWETPSHQIHINLSFLWVSMGYYMGRGLYDLEYDLDGKVIILIYFDHHMSLGDQVTFINDHAKSTLKILTVRGDLPQS